MTALTWHAQTRVTDQETPRPAPHSAKGGKNLRSILNDRTADGVSAFGTAIVCGDVVGASAPSCPRNQTYWQQFACASAIFQADAGCDARAASAARGSGAQRSESRHGGDRAAAGVLCRQASPERGLAAAFASGHA